MVPDEPEHARTDTVLAHGTPAAPGVGQGELHVDVDDALDAIDAGTPVVLAVRTTSPAEAAAIAGATAVITELGGPECHAAVVARASGVPAVVSVEGLCVEADGVRIGNHHLDVGNRLLVDGSRGEVLRP